MYEHGSVHGGINTFNTKRTVKVMTWIVRPSATA
jgi:hypothetical protein